MVEWWNGGMVEWWNGGMVEWWNGGMVEWMVNDGMMEWILSLPHYHAHRIGRSFSNA
jgi:hypothetical protein